MFEHKELLYHLPAACVILYLLRLQCVLLRRFTLFSWCHLNCYDYDGVNMIWCRCYGLLKTLSWPYFQSVTKWYNFLFYLFRFCFYFNFNQTNTKAIVTIKQTSFTIGRFFSFFLLLVLAEINCRWNDLFVGSYNFHGKKPLRFDKTSKKTVFPSSRILDIQVICIWKP